MKKCTSAILLASVMALTGGNAVAGPRAGVAYYGGGDYSGGTYASYSSYSSYSTSSSSSSSSSSTSYTSGSSQDGDDEVSVAPSDYEVIMDSNHLRASNGFKDGYSPGEEGHLLPGETDSAGWRAQKMITFDRAAGGGWYKDMQGGLSSTSDSDTAWLNQDLGLAFMKLPAADCAGSACTYADDLLETVRDTSNGMHPTVFAKYDPYTRIGVINVQRIETMGNGDLLVVQKRFDPRDGGPSTCVQDSSSSGGCLNTDWPALGERNDIFGFANKFGGNPFTEFMDSANPEVWANITPEAFYAIVGSILIQQRASVAWVANLNVRDQVVVTENGLPFRKDITYNLSTYGKPRWTMITHPSIPTQGAEHFAFRLANGQEYRLGLTANVRQQGNLALLPGGEELAYSAAGDALDWKGLAMFSFASAQLATASPLGALAYADGSEIKIASLGTEADMDADAAAIVDRAMRKEARRAIQNTYVDNTQINAAPASGNDSVTLENKWYDWRRASRDTWLSGSSTDINDSVGAMGQWFGANSIDSREKFVGGFFMRPDQNWDHVQSTRRSQWVDAWGSGDNSQEGQ